MTNLEKAAHMALLAMSKSCLMDNNHFHCLEAITALRQALKQPEPQHKPLTEEQIEDIRIEQEFDQWAISKNAFKYAARAIESVHGIKE